jgi:NAD(P)-dependent dehydrogenase (short-subunit alcohol dehydrogenase family)
MALLDGKVCLITGSGGGLGRAASLLFAAEGGTIVVNDLDGTAGEETVSLVEEAGGEAAFFAGDVADDGSVRELFDRAVERFGRLDVSYHNAGIMHPDDVGPEDTSLDVWQKTIDINLKGVFLCCRHAIPKLRDSGGGSIINVASFVALMGAANPQIAYTASKGGVLSMTREIAVQHARQGIRANALCPGPVRTPLLEPMLRDDERRENRLNHIPLYRFAEPDDIAKAALFLASDLSSYMTGTSLVVDGGITAAYLTKGP